MTCIATQELFAKKLAELLRKSFGTGGLSFLMADLAEAASKKNEGGNPTWNMMMLAGGYAYAPDGRTPLNLNEQPNITKLAIDGKDTFDVPWGNKGKTIPTSFFAHEVADGIPLILPQDKDQRIMGHLYPEIDHRLQQNMFLAQAGATLFAELGLAPDVLMTQESQLAEVMGALQHLVKEYRANINDVLGSVTVYHTSQRAALDRGLSSIDWLRLVYGDALDLPWMQDMLQKHPLGKHPDAFPGAHDSDAPENVTILDKVQAAATASNVIVTVDQDSLPSQRIMTPDHIEKVVYVNNGSSPELWTPADVLRKYREGSLTVENLFAEKMQLKERLSAHLANRNLPSMRNLDAMTVSAPRRQVEYKRGHAMTDPFQDFSSHADYICGDLGCNLVIAGQAKDRFGKAWVQKFPALMQKFPGQFYYIPESDIDLMQMIIQGSDLLLHCPHDQEQCGTSWQRALQAFTLVIATLCGGPAHGIRDGKNGWAIDVYSRPNILIEKMEWSDMQQPYNPDEIRKRALEVFYQWDGHNDRHPAITMMNAFEEIIRPQERRLLANAAQLFTNDHEAWGEMMLTALMTGIEEQDAAHCARGYAELATQLASGRTDTTALQNAISQHANFSGKNPKPGSALYERLQG